MSPKKWNEVESIFFELFSPEVNICEQNVNIREQTFLVTMKILHNFAASNLKIHITMKQKVALLVFAFA